MRNSENGGVSVVFRRLEEGELKVFAVNAQRHTSCIGILLESQSHPSCFFFQDLWMGKSRLPKQLCYSRAAFSRPALLCSLRIKALL